MAKIRRISKAKFDKAVKAFREKPQNYSNAKRAAGISFDSAKRLWFFGIPSAEFSAPPIKDMLGSEKELGRAERELKKKKDAIEEVRDELADEIRAEAARRDAIDAREKEGQILKLARQNAISSMASLVRIGQGIQVVSQKTLESLNKIANEEDYDHSKGIAVLRAYAKSIREVASASQTIMEMERLYMGEPTEIVGVTTDIDNLTIEQLAKEIEKTETALDRAQQRGIIVLEGGMQDEE